MLALFGGFTLWPTIASWLYSLYDWDGISSLSDYVGFANYREAWHDPNFWTALRHSVYFSVAAVVIELPIALLLALVLNNPQLRGRNLYRLMIFLPVVSTTAVVGVVFAILLNPVGGPVNNALTDLGLTKAPVDFLSARLALPTLIGISIWKGMGISVIYWLAALQTVPTELLEAARVDGTSSLRILLRITLPIVGPIAVVIVLLTFLRSLNPFDLVETMTGGGPLHATDVLATYLYDNAFNPEFNVPRYGYASAVGVMFGLLVVVMVAVQTLIIRLVRRRRVER